MPANFVDKTIWTGDNLDILRGLNSESVDLIYLDPPWFTVSSSSETQSSRHVQLVLELAQSTY